jgi:hypothetical protein
MRRDSWVFVLAYVEFWLEMREKDNAFRVMLLLFEGVDPPNKYVQVDNQMVDCGRDLYASPWLPSIHAAENEMTTTARSYSDRDVKIMIFREIRKPNPSCVDSGSGTTSASKKRRERGH